MTILLYDVCLNPHFPTIGDGEHPQMLMLK